MEGCGGEKREEGILKEREKKEYKKNLYHDVNGSLTCALQLTLR